MQFRIAWLVAGTLGAGALVALLAGSDPAGESGPQGSPAFRPGPEEAAISTGEGPVISSMEERTGGATPDERAADAGPPPVTTRAASPGEEAAETGDGTARGSQTLEVGEYVDPEGIPIEQDTTVIRVGDYLDPDSEFTGD